MEVFLESKLKSCYAQTCRRLVEELVGVFLAGRSGGVDLNELQKVCRRIADEIVQQDAKWAVEMFSYLYFCCRTSNLDHEIVFPACISLVLTMMKEREREQMANFPC